ncbi:short-chain-enoyl-CoA hydratase-like [Xenia sp. Carnegie-2017]|uniref:short-chain-enoyl-CoA hydratase-like n=1 Tax=Xenia sp. Carnegie-2017 TaxID=2897299 RepID=UPI001F03E0C7|nr:short-chain-enoyl-CoA hydratase-like [Xenia sp. Carnegie-2017]
MAYEGFKTFNVKIKEGVAWVTFDFPPVNVQGKPMLDDLNRLAELLEKDRTVKVVVFQSAHPEIFVCHADIDMLVDIPAAARSRSEPLLYLQEVLQRISDLPQATIAKVEGVARGGGHEFMLACDMRFAARGKSVFMQMEVGMGIVPCGGGTQRLARQMGMGRAMEIILGARDFDADLAERYGSINRALEPNEIGPFVEKLANRIAKFPAGSIAACKRCVIKAVETPIDEGLKEEAYQLGQAMASTPGARRFAFAKKNDMQNNLENQRNWEKGVMDIQNVE